MHSPVTRQSDTVGVTVGDRFHSMNGQRSGVLGELLGQGGQGAVYRCTFGSGDYAVKWYHDYYVDIDKSLKGRLKKAIARGAPDKRFLWPLELVAHPKRPSCFGYIMGLRPSEFQSIRELLASPPKRIELSLEKRLYICWQIADSFLSLHAYGFCYQDINFGNFFIHPASGRVMICDNDNVNVDGAQASVYGTRKFMAPEIVRREATPNSRTDLYSMAVLFFYILVGWHPLDGKREAEAKLLTQEMEYDLYGANPLFMFDANDTTNGPLSPLHDMLVCRWKSLPGQARALFRQAFGAGLHNSNGRVIEKSWLRLFEGFQRAGFSCHECRYGHIHDIDNPELNRSCVYCSAPLHLPPMLRIGAKSIALNKDAVVTQADFGNLDAPRWESLAVLVEHPTQPDIVGLRNTTSEPWRARTKAGNQTLVSPGRTVLLSNGLQLEIGPHKATVIAPNGHISLHDLTDKAREI